MNQLFLLFINMFSFFTQSGFAFPEYKTMVLKITRNILNRSIKNCALARVFYPAIVYASAIGRGTKRFIVCLNLF